MAENNPHDSLVRHVMSKADVAAAGLRALLPPESISDLDLSSVRLMEGTFIDEAFREKRTDLLFELASNDGAPVYAYILAEHQSSVDRDMPWRMHQYITRIWARWKAGHPNSTGRLPRVIPLVIYHGERRWTGPTTLREMMHGEGLVSESRYLPGLEFFLVDLTVLSEEEVIARSAGASPWFSLLLLNLKTMAYIRDVTVALRRWGQLYLDLMRLPGGWENSIPFFRYTLLTHSEMPDITLVRALKTVVNDLTGEEIMPYANRYLEALEGRGEARGEARGRSEARIEDTMKLISRKFPDEAESARAWVEQATSEQLDGVFDRIFEATTLADLLGRAES
ncbi:MAG: Rpn family recombination-promoting nuclease/putative transposase [Bradymonadia bacterium]